MDFYQRYFDSAIHFLSIRPRSEKEVRDNLKKKKATPEIIEKIVQRLLEKKFLNDMAFTQWFIDQRSRFSPKSTRIIRLELPQKGISAEILEQVFQKDKSQLPNDLEQAKKLVERKKEKYKGLPTQELYQKLGGFLARRGFGWDVIKSAIDETFNKEYNTPSDEG